MNLTDFLASNTIPIRTAGVAARQLYRAYRAWCQDAPLTREEFTDQMHAHGYALIRQAGRPAWRHLALRRDHATSMR